MIEYLKSKKKAVLIIFVLVVLFGIYLYNQANEYTEAEESQKVLLEEKIENEQEEKEEKEENFVIVHVAGSVKKPGIVKLPDGSRVEDAINAAGGLTEDADITYINLACVLEDGIKLRIPSINDTIDNNEAQNTKYIIEGIGTEEQKTSKTININTASLEELQNLNGVGPSLASKIIEYRKENGKFKTIEDIKNVSGIGENKFEEIKNQIKI